MRNLPQGCTPRNRCGNARTCDHCARARQRRLADQAEKLEQHHGQLTLTVLVPDANTLAAIHTLRASFLRRALAPAGIWTVEAGTEYAGLHLNILSPRPAPARWKNASTYSELVNTTAREAAAYIAKRSGMPPAEQYAGRLCGQFGQLLKYMTSDQAHPVVQAAAIESTINPKKQKQTQQEFIAMKSTPATKPNEWVCRNDLIDGSKPLCYYPDEPQASNPPWQRREKTKEERLAILKKHLPGLYAATGKSAQNSATNTLANVPTDA
jgi:hypothetical protein